MAARPQAQDYVPPDPTRIDVRDPRALGFWSATLGKSADEIRAAVAKVGPLLEHVKSELGMAGE
ncbi:MAG TPA: DUF3606 domain-containing protein [Burkholderiales bacterium]